MHYRNGSGRPLDRRENKGQARVGKDRRKVVPPGVSGLGRNKQQTAASVRTNQSGVVTLSQEVFSRRLPETSLPRLPVGGFAPGTENLPMHRAVPTLIKALMNNRAAVVEGETGCGKTLVGTLAIHAARSRISRADQVVLCVPRRAVAVLLADRLSEIKGTEVGALVGYAHGLEKKCGNGTEVLVTTNGSQLMRELRSPSSARSVIILDEVHELSAEVELLLGLLRLRRERDHTGPKVGVMSATMNSQRTSFHLWNAPRISVEGRQHKVIQRPAPKAESLKEILKAIPTVVKGAVEEGKNIIVVVPRKRDIDTLIDAVSELCSSAEVYPFHGGLTDEERAQALGPYTKPAVVIATNLIQTSVTPPHADVVIASGWVLRSRVDPDGVVHLSLELSTKPEIFQQFGRVGRTKDGEAILCGASPLGRLYEVPSGLQTSRLDSLYLQIYGYEDFRQINRHCLNPASEEQIKGAEKRLRQLCLLGPRGHLTKAGRFVKGLAPFHHGEVAMISHQTPLVESEPVGGRVLPISPHLGKILYQAVQEGERYSTRILESAIDAVAVAEEQEPIVSGEQSAIFRQIGFVPSSEVVVQGAMLGVLTSGEERTFDGLEIDRAQLERVIKRRARLREAFNLDPMGPTQSDVCDNELALKGLHEAVRSGYINSVFFRAETKEDGSVTYRSIDLKGDWVLSRHAVDTAPLLVVGEPRRIDYVKENGDIGTRSFITHSSTVSRDWIKGNICADLKGPLMEALRQLQRNEERLKKIRDQRSFRRPPKKGGGRR